MFSLLDGYNMISTVTILYSPVNYCRGFSCLSPFNLLTKGSIPLFHRAHEESRPRDNRWLYPRNASPEPTEGCSANDEVKPSQAKLTREPADKVAKARIHFGTTTLQHLAAP